ncbi:hypothetical protein NC653_014623 [Populus alba x Populus x berolinensis]|uniref:histone acetyltransferase n=1 Tax=Populus alba x Populus x berolinensis TaxID=444605 RepID=A0AAD6QXQ4_9ROSI|nr:hypothetical protein NC653_014623 [Populus alba x Populus x berolinensis]
MKISCWILFCWLFLCVFASGSLSIDNFNRAYNFFNARKRSLHMISLGWHVNATEIKLETKLRMRMEGCLVHTDPVEFGMICFPQKSMCDFSFSSLNPFPIIEPDPNHTKLHLASEGLEAIKRITNPIAAVAVIGPYRSGKSFLLNQLLSLSCYEGFGVGHMRDTKTKGIWVWGTPVELDINGVKTSVFYLDTEGFESIGKSNVYDDRIFALATVLSSVLIYNLPETIREADISRLSFAVELAEEFYGRSAGQDVAFEPAKLLWLIQRDFLQGKSVQEMVNEALQHVPNNDGDRNIDQVNQIRDSLAIMGDNSTAFSLPQPHLLRTKLCDMKDGELDPMYVKKRDQLKELVASIIRPKIVQGRPLNGKEFVAFLEQGILERCLKLYSEMMAKLPLPLSEKSLQNVHENSKGEAMKSFDEQHFGRHHAKRSVMQLDEEIEKVYKHFVMANEYQSAKLCEALYSRCEDRMDQLQVLRLPSMAKFNAGFLQCNQSFEQECVGPSKANYELRMMKMMGKSKSSFIKEYNHRLFNWLVVFSLVMVVVGRFIIKFILIEISAWIPFIFLETYTRMFWSAESLYYNPVWHFIVATWETLVYSPFLDLDRWAIPLGLVAAILVVYWRCYDTRDGALTSNDDLESISARGADSDSDDAEDSETVLDDEEEDFDNDSSMRTFTTARLETTNAAGSSSRNTKIKMENTNVKIENSDSGKDGGNIETGAVGPAAAGSSGPGILVKEDSVKIFTENLQASGAYSAREESLKREEEAGKLKFVCYSNDDVDEHMVWLIGLKNIFARQLPNMPKEYIVRLVMDRSHKSVMIIRRNQVVGGITYRPYVSQRFGEIAFCAITADEQVKGYGTRLMNHLKQHARDVDGLTHFLTYADNNAVGYFIKQGFTKEIYLEKDRWQGYIKDYDGGILMECKIDQKLPYTDLSTMIRRQRQAIDEKIRELSNCHIIYPGIDFLKGRLGGLLINGAIHSMHDHVDAWPFKEPVDARDVPDYYDIIKDPMDLKTMSKRVESEQYYVTLEMFIADVKRMCANARTYNSPDTIYYKLEAHFQSKVQSGIQSGTKILP